MANDDGARVHQLTEALWAEYPGDPDLGVKQNCVDLAVWLVARGLLLPPVPPRCPECVQGKHSGCTGWAVDDADVIVPCGCQEEHGA